MTGRHPGPPAGERVAGTISRVVGTTEELLADAELALGQGDFDAALSAAMAAVDRHEGPAASGLAAGLLYLDGRPEEALPHAEAAFAARRAAGEARQAARTAIDVGTIHASLGRPAAQRGWLERARTLLEPVGPCVEWGHLELAVMACERPDTDDLLLSTERALAVAVEFGDVSLEARARADAGLALVTRGEVPEGFARLDSAMAAIAAGEVDPVAAGMCFCSMLTACDRTGDVDRAEEWTTTISSIIDGLGQRPRVLHTHCRLAYGSVLCAAGRWPEAEALLLEALGPADRRDMSHRALIVAHLAGLRLDQGRAEEATELLAPFEDQVVCCLPLARVHLAAGEPDLAAATAQRGLDELVGDALRRAPLLALMVDVELARDNVDEARDLARELAATVEGTDLADLAATAAIADGRVRAAEGDRAGRARRVRPGQGGAGQRPRPCRVGTVRLELAGVLVAGGERAAAIDEARAALACFERLGADSWRNRATAVLRDLGEASAGRRVRVADRAGDLTAREREVLDQVRQGCTNAEIAERLFISPKTAEHHVGRVLAKLGVRSRAEAAALAVRLSAEGQD